MTPAIFSHNPALHISGIVICPEPKTIAFGGVAIGIINAKLAANVAGNTNKYGCMPAPTEMLARIGTSVAVVAVLDVNSVRNITPAQIINTNTTSGTF